VPRPAGVVRPFDRVAAAPNEGRKMAENDDVASMLATLTPDDLAFLRPETREAAAPGAHRGRGAEIARRDGRRAATAPVGSNYSHTGLDQLRRARPCCSPVTLSFVYQLLRRMFGLVRAHRPDAFSKEAEILVLRHQLAVLRRQSSGPGSAVRPGAHRTARRAGPARAVALVPCNPTDRP